MLSIIFAFMLILLAGIINGSFALPTKYVTKWKFENIWLQYAIWAFVILPWLITSFLAPQIFIVYKTAPSYLLWVMLLGGLVFGAGQVCFALALDMIGFSLGFVINLGLGIMLGFLLPLLFQHPQEILHPFGIITLIGCIFAVTGLILSNFAGSMHNQQCQGLNSPNTKQQSLYVLGVILAIVAGLSSAGQNFSFSLTYSLQQIALHAGATRFGASFIMWPGFLLCAFIPYAIYMLYLQRKNRSFNLYAIKGTGKYYVFAFLMGIFWYGSLIFYSKAAHLIGDLGPLVGWPLFMVLIILTSTFWGWKHQEWAGCSTKIKHTLWAGLITMIVAVIILGYSSVLHT